MLARQCMLCSFRFLALGLLALLIATHCVGAARRCDRQPAGGSRTCALGLQRFDVQNMFLRCVCSPPGQRSRPQAFHSQHAEPCPPPLPPSALQRGLLLPGVLLVHPRALRRREWADAPAPPE